MLKRFAISSRLLRCDLSHPSWSHCRKLKLVPYYEELLPFQDPGEKVVPSSQLLLELGLRVYSWIDLAAKHFLRALKAGNNFAEAGCADHHQIDIAIHVFVLACN